MHERDLAVLFGIGLPACLLLAGSIVVFLKGRTASAVFNYWGRAALLSSYSRILPRCSICFRGCVGA